jgi:hypothetical protein
MNHTGRTIITINGGTYPVKFGMGALLHFSEGLGYDVQETIEALTKPGVGQIKSIAKFIYAALYVDALYKEKEFTLTFDDVIDWVDSNATDEISKVMVVIMHGISSITKVDYPSEEAGGSKKK